MNRTQITPLFYTELKEGLRGKKSSKKVHAFIAKWKPTLTSGKLYHGKKEIVHHDMQEKIMKREAIHNGMPLSRDGAHSYLMTKYVGIKKVTVADWLKRIEQLQLIHKRPFKNTRPSRQMREGSMNYFMKTSLGGRFNLGIDLFQMPKPQWSSYSFFFVGVLQRNLFTWIIPMKNKKANTSLVCLKEIFRDCKKRFGSHPTGCTSDKGNEFLGSFDKYLLEHGIVRKTVRLCPWVEKRNSTLARIFGVMRTIHGFEKSLDLTRIKVNNIKSRITKKAPVDWLPEDFLKKTRRYNNKLKAVPKLRKQPVFETGNRVRTLQKQALGKEPFYKSYEGMRSRKHAMWSKTIYNITARKKKGRGFIYKVNDKWRPPYELQLISGSLVVLEVPKPPPAPREPKRYTQSVQPPKMYSTTHPTGLRRSTRVKRRVRYF
jgi:hypothetical protein